MTIGNFPFILKKAFVQRKLGNLCCFDLGRDDLDEAWWGNHCQELYDIVDLRNDCCHGGDLFTAAKLEELLKKLFDDGALEKVVVYNDITNRIN